MDDRVVNHFDLIYLFGTSEWSGVKKSELSLSSSQLKIKDRDFLEAFDVAASKTLSELGEDVRTAILFHISKIEGVKPEDSLKDPLQFGIALEKIFSAGSTILEDKIIETICSELDLSRLDIGGTFDQKIGAAYELLYKKKANSQFYPRAANGGLS